MEMLQGVWKQHLRPRAVVGYGFKIFLPSPPNYVTRSPGLSWCHSFARKARADHSRKLMWLCRGVFFSAWVSCGQQESFTLMNAKKKGFGLVSERSEL